MSDVSTLAFLPLLGGIGLAIGMRLFAKGLTEWSIDAAKRKGWKFTIDRKRLNIAFIAGVVVTILTGWPVGGALVAAMTYAFPRIFGGRRRAEAMIARTEGIASWIENLRDTLAGSSGLRRAIIASASNPPPSIADELTHLSQRLSRREPMAEALHTFAAETDDPAADLVVMALILADDPNRHAGNLRAVLGTLAAAVRSEATMQRRVSAGRAKVRAGVVAITGMTLSFVTGMVVLNREFLTPYDNFLGQIVLGLIGGAFAIGLWRLDAMAAIGTRERFFTGNLDAQFDEVQSA